MLAWHHEKNDFLAPAKSVYDQECQQLGSKESSILGENNCTANLRPKWYILRFCHTYTCKV
jgi:hypothetical protein